MLLGGSIHSFEASRLLLKSIVYEWDGNEAKYILLDGHTGSHDIDGLGTLVGQLQIKGNSATRGQIFVSRHDDVLVVDVHINSLSITKMDFGGVVSLNEDESVATVVSPGLDNA